MREIPFELENEAEQLTRNTRRTVVLAARDPRDRTGLVLRVTPAGARSLSEKLAGVASSSEDQRVRFTLAADLEVVAP